MLVVSKIEHEKLKKNKKICVRLRLKRPKM